MTRADNTSLLIEAARRRSRSARHRTLEAVAILAASGEAVTPTAVARRASVSRQWLYTFDEALDAIRAASASGRSTRSVVPHAQGPSAASLQRRVEALTDDNQRLRGRVQELEQRLAALYGQWRAKGELDGQRDLTSHRQPLPNRGQHGS
jgi:hypothetical protein